MKTKKIPNKKEIDALLEKDRVLDALNRLDELASLTTEDNDNGEAQEQERDYNLVFDWITKQYKNNLKNI